MTSAAGRIEGAAVASAIAPVRGGAIAVCVAVSQLRLGFRSLNRRVKAAEHKPRCGG